MTLSGISTHLHIAGTTLPPSRTRINSPRTICAPGGQGGQGAEDRLRGCVAVIAVVAVLGAAALPARGGGQEPVGTAALSWANGDWVKGKLISMTGTHLHWQAAPFSAPFTLDRKLLESVQFARSNVNAWRGDVLRFDVRTGDVLYGRLVELADDHVVIESSRHGRTKIFRSALQGFRGKRLPALRSGDLAGVSAWTTLRRGRQLSEWDKGEAGELSTTHTGAELLSEAKLPPMAEIELYLRWNGEPGFLVGFASPTLFGEPSFAPLKLETWGDELVLQNLQADGNFEQVGKVTARSRIVRLRLYWNQFAGELSVFSRHGRLLGKLTGEPEAAAIQRRLYIRNQGSDLTIAEVQISEWRGSTPKEAMANLSRVLLIDGTVVYCRALGFDRSNSTLAVTEAAGDQREFALDRVASVYFSEVISSRPKPEQDTIAYFDGAVLRGHVESVENDVVKLKTRYSDQPVSAGLAGARELKFAQSPQRERDSHKSTIEVDGYKLHGELVPFDQTLGWQLVGSVNASPLPSNCVVRVVLEARDDSQRDADHIPVKTEPTDVVFLRTGEIIPCRVHTLDDGGLHIATELSAETRIPLSHLKAIELGSDVNLPVSGFDDGWELGPIKNTVDRTAESIVFRGPGTLSHESVLRGDEVSFDAAWNTNGGTAMTVRLCQRSARGGEPLRAAVTRMLQVQIYFLQQNVHVRGAQVQNQGMIRGIQATDGRARLRFALKDDEVHFSVNDHHVTSQKFIERGGLARGMVFEVQQVHMGGKARPGRAAEHPEMLTISNFRVSRSKGVLGGLSVDGEKLRLVLTVPRMRKDNPPTHVLLARNGDLVRGRLIDITADHAHFQSRLTDFALPRERVAGIVWLDEQAADVADAARPSPAASAARTVLRNGAAVSFVPDRVVAGALVGNSEILGRCRIPIEEIQELYLGSSVGSRPDEPYVGWVLQPAVEPQFAGSAGADSAVSPMVGTVAEDFQLPLIDNGHFRLSEHSGKVVILDFWATWCGPCVKSLPKLIEAAEAFPRDRVMLIAVNQQETEQAVDEFLAARGWQVPVALDRDGRIGRQFQVEALPQTVIIGPDGKIRQLHIGANSDLEQELKQAVGQMLDGPIEERPDQKDGAADDAKEPSDTGESNGTPSR